MITLILLAVVLEHVIAEVPPSVSTGSTVFYGRRVQYGTKSVDAYLGVPYAEPPLGNLRFKKTKPLRQIPPLFNATSFPPACIQYSFQPFPWYDGGPGQSENCLFLNIWVPSRPVRNGRRLSVIYWAHGGGFTTGSNRLKIYDGKALAAVGDVIVVAVNYRLGPLGFLYSKTNDAPGNMGVHDILEGLKWINRNINFFGGNRNSITVAGESAGSLVAGYFLMSSLTKGLFKRAIMESSSPVYTLQITPKNNFEFTEKLAKSVGCAHGNRSLERHPAKVLKCMRDKEADVLIKASAQIAPNAVDVFLIQYGDDILPDDPLKTVKAEEFHDSEILIGSNSKEGSVLVATGFPDIFGFYGDKRPMLNKAEATRLFEMASKIRGLQDPEHAFRKYLNGVADNDHEEIKNRLYDAFGDFLIKCSSVFFAEKFSSKYPVYFYQFDHRPSNSLWSPSLGATHFDEVAFVFGQPAIHPEEYDRTETVLSINIMLKWTNFAKYGIPDSSWPQYTKSQPFVQVLSTRSEYEVKIGRNPTCDYYRPIYGF